MPVRHRGDETRAHSRGRSATWNTVHSECWGPRGETGPPRGWREAEWWRHHGTPWLTRATQPAHDPAPHAQAQNPPCRGLIPAGWRRAAVRGGQADVGGSDQEKDPLTLVWNGVSPREENQPLVGDRSPGLRWEPGRDIKPDGLNHDEMELTALQHDLTGPVTPVVRSKGK